MLQLGLILYVIILGIAVIIALKANIDLERKLDNHIANKKMHEC